jgi:hypothetical protein
MIITGGTCHSEINKLINSVFNKEELPQQWKESIILPIYKKGDKTDCSNCRGISLLSTTYKFYPIFFLQSQFHKNTKLLGSISMDFNVTDPLSGILYSPGIEKNWMCNGKKYCVTFSLNFVHQ